MDEIVAAALRKWPKVPHCYGWLALDARGQWWLRDERAQAAGPFPQVKGSAVVNERLRDFIARNYDRDPRGCWFFQNGPQRVYVELEAAPWVWRLHEAAAAGAAPRAFAHTGRSAQLHRAWLDEAGRLFLDSDIGLGIVHSMDMGIAAVAVERGHWAPAPLRFEDMAARFGHELRPQPD